MRCCQYLWAWIALGIGLPWGAVAAEAELPRALPAAAEQPIDFARDIMPIFATHCNHCHGEDDQQAQLRLDARTIVMAGGVSGPAIKPGDAAGSLLIERVLGSGGQERMPPDDDPLSDAHLALLRGWIEQGAVWPAGVGVENARVKRHWAYETPTRPALPAVSRPEWPRNSIDHFILARLDQAQLAPAPEADRARLLRRVYLDLIGLPPTVEEVDAFLADPRSDAFEQVVDMLLSSPRFGERWATPWLDGARYADSNGFQRDGHRTIWAYRDWVVDALNRDMPFDQFTIEQLAGDLLPEPTASSRIATGFHRCTTVNVEAGVDQEENRVNQVIDRVNVTGTIWLGSTLECAQCHNHKYDPFTQKDYYQLFAYFNNTALETDNPGGGATLQFTGPMMELEMPPEVQSRRSALQAEQAVLKADLQQAQEAARARLPEWERQWSEAARQPAAWHVLEIADFKSAQGSQHERLDDGSVLLVGKPSERDTYTATIDTELTNITALKLETLTDPSLPGQGPGRGDAERPNFVLHEFAVTAAPRSKPRQAQAVAWRHAEADFSQRGYDVAQAIDGDLGTAWAINPQFHKPHWALFTAAEPLGHADGTRLVVTLEQRYGGGRLIGRFRLLARTGEAEGLPEEVAAVLATAPEQRTRKQRAALEKYLVDGDARVSQLRAALAQVEKQLSAIRPPTSLVMVEMDTPRDTNILVRGDFLNPGAAVRPGTPAVLHKASETLPPNRLGLAQWLVDANNPLLPRVTVNRWWAELFGQGIVSTEEDFGAQCEPPTHPELLDWLAVEFVDSGWSMKHMLRLIVTSATYRQAAAVDQALLERDPNNKLYSRGPRRRLDAEFIRDNALAIAGVLSVKQGGPPVYPPQPDNFWRVTGNVDNRYPTSRGEDRYRRGLYTVWRRSAPYPSFTNFDATDRSACVVKRARTNTPLQALTLLNDPVYVELAARLAVRLIEDRDRSDATERAEYGFRRCVARHPNDTERAVLMGLAADAEARYRDDPAAARALVAGLPASDQVDWKRFDPVELATWFEVSAVLLNLDETIVK